LFAAFANTAPSFPIEFVKKSIVSLYNLTFGFVCHFYF
jgi:hypothetical protein